MKIDFHQTNQKEKLMTTIKQLRKKIIKLVNEEDPIYTAAYMTEEAIAENIDDVRPPYFGKRGRV